MKRIVFVLTFLVAIGYVCAQQATLQGVVSGLPSGTKMYLRQVQGNKFIKTDSVTIAANGRYLMPVSVSSATFFVMNFSIDRCPDVHVFLLPNESVTLNMRYSAMYGHLRITKVEGSRNMEEYRRFNNLIPSGQDEASQWNLRTNVEEIITEFSDCIMSAFLVTFFEEQFNEYGGLYKLVRDRLYDRYADNEFVRHIDSKLKTSVVVGMDAPDIAMKDMTGKIRKLSDLRGKIVLLDFWASWCGPCRKENPNVVNLYKKYHAQGFDIYSVSLDKSKDAWAKAIADDGLVWENHVSDLSGWTSSGGKTYGISSVPSTVLIDKDGKIIARNLRGGELAAKLKELFGN